MPSPKPVRRKWKRPALHPDKPAPRLTPKQVKEVLDTLPQVTFDSSRRRKLLSFIRHERALFHAEMQISKYPSSSESREALIRVRDAAANLGAELSNLDELARDALCHAVGKAPAQYARGENGTLPAPARGRSRVGRIEADAERLAAGAVAAIAEIPDQGMKPRRNSIDRILQRYMMETGEEVSRSGIDGGARAFAEAVLAIVIPETSGKGRISADADIRAWVEARRSTR